MNIQVTTLLEAIEHPAATTWHVDEQGILHVIAKGDETATVATYAKGQWQSVVRAPESECECRPVADAVTEAIGRGWKAGRR